MAAGSVLIFHVWLYGTVDGPVDLGYFSRFVLPHLPVGVTLFFALSGYLLYRPIVAKVLADGRMPSVRNYFRNRALRILPAYWVILAVVGVALPAALVRVSSSEVVLDRLVSRPGALIGNAVFVQNYVPTSLDTGIGPAWSLAVEVIFYLSLPLLGLLAVSCFKRARTARARLLSVLAPAVALFVVGLAGKATTVWLLPPQDSPGHAILARSFLSHADLFAPGMALAVLHVMLVRGEWRLPPWWPRMLGTVLVATVALVVLLNDRELLTRWGVLNSYQRLTSLACVLLVALVVLPRADSVRGSWLIRVLEARPVMVAGLASYSLFLWHEPVVRFFTQEGLTRSGKGGFFANLLLIIVTSAVLATLTYRYVERPALARKVTTSAGSVPRARREPVQLSAPDNVVRGGAKAGTSAGGA